MAVLLLTGCHGGLNIPPEWVEAQDVDSPRPARMQVILCFGPMTSNHSVVRLDCGDDVAFWDPGGMYAIEVDGARRADMVVIDPPTAEQFWEFRRKAASEVFHLVFEWDLTEQVARDKCEALAAFDTDRPGGACCKAVCEFMQVHGRDLADVPSRWLFPHTLAKHLWTQPVDRVRVYAKDEQPRVYVRR